MANTVKKYWFKRRRYGYGWTPVTWQGWVTIGIYLFALLGYAFTMDEASPEGTIEDVYAFLGVVTGMTLSLIAITVIKGPRPKWRWVKRATTTHQKTGSSIC